MKIVEAFSDILPHQPPLVLAVGFFDGLHLGHRAVLATAKERARALGSEVWVLTFKQHPATITRPQSVPPLLTGLEQRLKLLEEQGLDGALVIDFALVRPWDPEHFVEHLLTVLPQLKEIVVGSGWSFGYQQRGNVSLLKELTAESNVGVLTVPPVTRGGEVISSTRIRQTVKLGNLAEAEAMLGRPFSILGNVCHGKEVGRTLGYPTANIEISENLCLPEGIFAGAARLADKKHSAAVYIGRRPTFVPAGQEPPRVVEVYLLDEVGDLYGQKMETSLYAKIRDDRSFPSVAELKTQITCDVQAIRQLLAQRSV